jgi:hypothetical protein
MALIDELSVSISIPFFGSIVIKRMRNMVILLDLVR